MTARNRTVRVLAGAVGAWCLAGAAVADGDAAVFGVAWDGDVMGPVAGDARKVARGLSALTLSADVDLEKALGWRGGAFHADVLSTSGAEPNLDVGTLQGVNNIETERHRTVLLTAWVQQSFADGRASLLAGLYDVNSEFYVGEAASLFVHPSFGIGPEFSAAGPALYPATSLAVRGRATFGERGYVQAVVSNATLGVPGDPDGVDTDFDGGVLTVVEGGIEGETKLAVGAWSFSERFDDLRQTDAFGDPVKSRAQGAYVLVERPFAHEGGPSGAWFVKAGVSDGDTTEVSGAVQAGFVVNAPFAARPDGVLGFGVAYASISDKARANAVDAGGDLARGETAWELTYSDSLTEHVAVQPTLMVIDNPGGDPDADTAVVLGVRFSLAWSSAD